MKRKTIFTAAIAAFCVYGAAAKNYMSFENSAAYIPPMCYTKTKDENRQAHNPCYSCHTKGVEPNYMDDSSLQVALDFPATAMNNRWKNLFIDRSEDVAKISDSWILSYIRTSNYLDNDGNIILQKSLPKNFEGYVPDCYMNFDDEGFDRDRTGAYTGWRAFRYYPFLGTFWPTNGSTDDVLIRLPEKFRKDKQGRFSIDIYKANLAIAESMLKQKSVTSEPIDEKKAGKDLDGDGSLGTAEMIKYTWNKTPMSYAGMAEGEQIAGGLLPVGTELLHTVRYVDWDDEKNQPRMSARMKEVRYAVKDEWMDYAQMKESYISEMKDLFISKEIAMTRYNGNGNAGMQTGSGWIYQGFIEDSDGNLRPQSDEETLFCMGCHTGIGATADTVFSYQRKLEGGDRNSIEYGWNHWSQKGLKGLKDQTVRYKTAGDQAEYAFYLETNHAGDEFRGNDEVMKKFFNPDGSLKPEMIKKLQSDISVLLFPSRERALTMNKAYRVIAAQQTFIYGRDATVNPPKNVLEKIEENSDTGITKQIY